MRSMRTTTWRYRSAIALGLTLAVAALVTASACASDDTLTASPPRATTTTTIPFANFVEMYYTPPSKAFELLAPGTRPQGHDIADSVVQGIVEIDGPCLYIHQLENWGDGGFHRDGSGAIHTYLLALPYTMTRYDSQTRSLWVERGGPIANGDKATVAGREDESIRPFDMCPLANRGRISGSLVPGLPEILCRGDGHGISGWVPGAGEEQPCV